MKRIVLTTVYSSLFSTLSAGLVLLFKENEKGMFLYFVVMVLGNIILPTFIAVLIYQYVKKKIKWDDATKTFVFRILTLLFLYPLCLVLWSVVDVISYNLGFSGFTIQAVIDDFNSEFSGFMVIAVLLALSIPSFDLLLERKRIKSAE